MITTIPADTPAATGTVVSSSNELLKGIVVLGAVVGITSSVIAPSVLVIVGGSVGVVVHEFDFVVVVVVVVVVIGGVIGGVVGGVAPVGIVVVVAVVAVVVFAGIVVGAVGSRQL